MPNLHEIVDDIIAREAAQAMAKVPAPVAPEPCADADPHPSETVENFGPLLAAAGLICGLFL